MSVNQSVFVHTQFAPVSVLERNQKVQKEEEATVHVTAKGAISKITSQQSIHAQLSRKLMHIYMLI